MKTSENSHGEDEVIADPQTTGVLWRLQNGRWTPERTNPSEWSHPKTNKKQKQANYSASDRGMKGGDSLNHRAKAVVDEPFMKTLKTVDPQYEKDILKHSESISRQRAYTNSISAIGVLHSNKSVTGVEDLSSSRSSNKPKSPQLAKPADPPDWSRLVPEFMR